MKTIRLLAIIASALVILSACNSEQNKAEKAVKQYLQRNLQDPKSYEPVSFSDVKKVQRSYKETMDYALWMRSYKDAKEEFDLYINYDVDKAEITLKFMKQYDSIMQAREAVFIPVTEYMIKHKYRAKNALGGTVTTESVYYLDTAQFFITYIAE